MSDRLSAAVAELVDALREELAADVPRGTGPDRLLSIPEAAAALGIGRTAVYGELAAGRLRSIAIGRRRLVPSSAIAAYTEKPAPASDATGSGSRGRRRDRQPVQA